MSIICSFFVIVVSWKLFLFLFVTFFGKVTIILLIESVDGRTHLWCDASKYYVSLSLSMTFNGRKKKLCQIWWGFIGARNQTLDDHRHWSLSVCLIDVNIFHQQNQVKSVKLHELEEDNDGDGDNDRNQDRVKQKMRLASLESRWSIDATQNRAHMKYNAWPCCVYILRMHKVWARVRARLAVS